VKLCHLLPAVLIALAGAVVVQADTVYFFRPGTNDIESISGTIVRETGGLLEIATESGRTVSIPKASVFQVIRGAPSTTEHSGFVPDPPPLTSAAYHYGIKGGMNISNMSVDPQELEEDDSLQSYAVGAWWGIPLNHRLAIRTEALYSVKGDAETTGGYTVSTRMSYIDVPVLAKIGFLHGSLAQPSLFLGPSLAVNLSANSKLEGDGSGVNVDVKDDVRALDFAVVVGGGVDFPVGERTLGVEVRYSKGLSNVAGDGANGSARNDIIAVMGSIGLQ
jgi:hypothetical protein